MTGTHPESEDFPWMIAVVDHPDRSDSAAYRHSRALMQKLVQTTPDWMLAGEDYQDHHGGSVWVKDDTGWMCLQLPLGIEWSAQFCADPAKVDRLRQYAARIVARFPDTLLGYEALGYTDAQTVLETPITDAADIAAWTDSIFNAGLPLPAATHTGVLPKAAGYHHYPKPIVDIDHFRRDDFQLFVTDKDGLPAAVVPVKPYGEGDGRVRLLAAHPDSTYAARLLQRQRASSRPVAAIGSPTEDTSLKPGAIAADDDGDLLAADDPLARQAYQRQQ